MAVLIPGTWAASMGDFSRTCLLQMLKWAELEHSYQEMNSHVLLPRVCPSKTPRHCFHVPVLPLVHGSQAYTLYTWKMGPSVWPRSCPRHPSVSVQLELCCNLVRGCSVGLGGVGVCTFQLGSTVSPLQLAHVSLHPDVRKPAPGHFSSVV